MISEQHANKSYCMTDGYIVFLHNFNVYCWCWELWWIDFLVLIPYHVLNTTEIDQNRLQ